MKRILALTVFLLAAVLLSGLASAQREVSDDEVNAVAKKLYCPVCENTPLDVCPTQACREWRELIRQQLSEGWTEEQVMDYFAANYGPQVLAQPPAQGFNLLIWILPLVGLAGGGAFLWRLLRRGQERRRSMEDLEPPGLRSPGLQGTARTGSRTAHKGPAERPGGADETTEPADISPEMLARIEREIEARF